LGFKGLSATTPSEKEQQDKPASSAVDVSQYAISYLTPPLQVVVNLFISSVISHRQLASQQ